MAHLIQLKQRIKLVDTIKKTTNAMRLISMSMHARLRQKKVLLDLYKKEIEQLYALTHITTPISTTSDRTLIIIIGSQKGLCGSFNTQLINYIKHDTARINAPTHDLVVVGKQMVDYFRLQNIKTLLTFGQFTSHNFVNIANEIMELIARGNYKTIITYNNYPRTFFVQKSQKVTLYPQNFPQDIPSVLTITDYLQEQEPAEFRGYLDKLYLKISLENVLFESLFAEQAARFIAMDSSTRNAENLLTEMKLDYNKLRQASITRELTDLTASL